MKTVMACLLLLLVACGTANTKTVDNTSEIKHYSSSQKNPLSDTTTHKPGEIEIFGIAGKDTTYITRMYRKEDGAVKRYETTVTGSSYDRSSYQWLNDSTVSLKLINTKNNKTQTLQLSGSGAVTTVE